MNNLTEINYNPNIIRIDRIKKYRYNDSNSKYRNYRNYINSDNKRKINPTEKFQLALENLKEGLREISGQYKEKEDLEEKQKKRNKTFSITTKFPKRSHNWNKTQSFSAPKYNDFLKRNKIQKRKIISNLNNNYLNKSKSLHISFLRNNNFSSKSAVFPIDNFTTKTISSIKDFRRPSYKGILASDKSIILNDIDINNIRLNRMTIDNNIKTRELNNMNIILKRQNKELRIIIRENKYKINDLLNNIKFLRFENQSLNNDKKKLLMHISNLENNLDINKNLSMNELELKSNQIIKLNDEIMRLNYILEEKQNEIVILNTNNRNAFSEYNYRVPKEENNIINIQNLQKVINDLKNENDYLKNKNKENGISNSSINNINEDRINKLIKENQKYKSIYNNLKNEYDKMKNYTLNIKNQRYSFEKEKNEYLKSIDSLTLQLNNLQIENNSLKNYVTNNKKESNNNINNENQLKNKINKLLEENKKLRNQIEQNNNNNIEFNYLKNDVEEKNNEIKDLYEKLKNLMSQLNSYKINYSEMRTKNSKLQLEIVQLNNKINSLENDIINNQQQIRDLDNLNNKLKIKVNSINSGSLNFNKQTEQQLLILKQKNEELEEQLLNSNNNIARQKKELIIENSDLKNKILNLNAQVDELENENHNNKLEICKLNELVKQLKEANNESQLYFNEIKDKDNEIKRLLEIIKNKENENEQLQGKFSSNNIIVKRDVNEEDLEELKKNIEESQKIF